MRSTVRASRSPWMMHHLVRLGNLTGDVERLVRGFPLEAS